MKQKIPFPKQFWIYMIIVATCFILITINIYRIDDQANQFVFLIEQFALFAALIWFLMLARAEAEKRNREMIKQRKKEIVEQKWLGIKPGDYDHVWFDFTNTERALVLKQGDRYVLYIQYYDEHTEGWNNIESVGVYDSLTAVKKALFYDSNFHCEENTGLDENGNEIYAEEIVINIDSVQNVYSTALAFLDAKGEISSIDFSIAHKQWCKKYHVKKAMSRYVCDRTNMNGERKMIFYTAPHVLIVANKEQENLWFELIGKMKSFEYYAFDAD